MPVEACFFRAPARGGLRAVRGASAAIASPTRQPEQKSQAAAKRRRKSGTAASTAVNVVPAEPVDPSLSWLERFDRSGELVWRVASLECPAKEQARRLADAMLRVLSATVNALGEPGGYLISAERVELPVAEVGSKRLPERLARPVLGAGQDGRVAGFRRWFAGGLRAEELIDSLFHIRASRCHSATSVSSSQSVNENDRHVRAAKLSGPGDSAGVRPEDSLGPRVV